MTDSNSLASSITPGSKILVVEDDHLIRTMIVELLRRADYRLLEAVDGGEALRIATREQPALIVMDVNMPEMGGFEALEILRRRSVMTPILMLSTHGEPERRIKGLMLGADDFMAKPFDPRELVVRVAALLRRTSKGKAAPQRLQRGDVTIDLVAKNAERAGAPLALTATEYAILEVLAREMGRPVSREQLLDAVWGYTSLPNTRTVETHIWRLRKKLGDSVGEGAWIQNRSGVGYTLAPIESNAVMRGSSAGGKASENSDSLQADRGDPPATAQCAMADHGGD